QFSSCTFKYRPQTRGISQFLLAESERLEVLEREVRALVELQELMASQELESRVLQRAESRLRDEEESLSLSVHGNSNEYLALGELSKALQDGDVDGIVADDLISNLTVLQQRSERLIENRNPSAPASAGGQQRFSRRSGAIRSLQMGHSFSFVDDFSDRPDLKEALPQSGFAEWSGRASNLNLDRWYLQNGSSPLNTSGSGLIVLSDGTSNSQQLNGGSAIPWDYFAQRDVTVNAITKDGKFLALNGRDQDEIQQLVEAGVNLLPGMTHAETGFWDPAIVTDTNGKASVIVTMPAKSTSWKVRAKGVNDNSLAGHAEASVLTKKDLFAELKLPSAFTTGDKAAIPVEIHNSLAGERQI
ncbi:MAG TPA: alpha-2-macroglobulin family protein, partial [Planctomycetaceae bacterium]|nr:alpha-2-macroglobulin family protein [Planctomycetaceae bacterium]